MGPGGYLKLRPFAKGPEQRCREHLEESRWNGHVLWERGEEGEKSENAVAMGALILLKGFSNEPILKTDVQIPKLPFSENLTVVFTEHVHERWVDYPTGLPEQPAGKVEHER